MFTWPAGGPSEAERGVTSFTSQLTQALPQHAQALPSLPSRGSGILHKYGAQHLEERRVGLQRWLAAVLLDSMWGNVEAAREWCVD
ncbi:Phox homologous domain [Ceraceosorus bombacis]|uniref:Phox homologous domain n=1 Tax=Ceraceosorus bombacis TaxID=401625 RepID=A0A0P1BGT2_9BASI|nr:Phox homologous domain [Ceraceosorus bombacis]